MDQEVELKLALSLADAERIADSGLLLGKPEEMHLVSNYFDTPDQLLRQAGFSLRIRSNGKRRIQTAKADGGRAAGLFSRREWEKEATGDFPVVEEGTPLAEAVAGRMSELQPAFEVAVIRDKWNVTEDCSHIEVVLDRGSILCGKEHVPICELELELKAGDPADLFALARRLDAIAPLRLSVLSKGERGYRTLAPMKGAIKAELVSLSSDMTAAQAFQSIAHNCLRQYRLNEDQLLVEGDHRAIHQARVALRRLRSAFNLFKPMLRGKRLKRFTDELRWLSSHLGQVRNLDVVMAACESTRLQHRLMEARSAAYAELRTVLMSERCRALMLDLAEWLSTGQWLEKRKRSGLRDQAATGFAQQALEQLCDHVLADGQGLEQLDDEARHEVRKAAKRLRYGAEFFAVLFDQGKQRKQRIRFLAALEKLQDNLGALNDLAVRQEVISQLGLDGETCTLSDWRAANPEALLKSASDDMKALSEAKRHWRLQPAD